jgi:hypothetical protein
MERNGCRGKEPKTEAEIKDEPGGPEKTDASGNRWRKVYTGGGSHFRHWLEQFKEVYGEENLVVEEDDPSGYTCFEESGEPMLSIWLKV